MADLSVDRGDYDYTGWLIVDVGFLGQFDRLVTKQKQHGQLVTSFPGNRKGFFLVACKSISWKVGNGSVPCTYSGHFLLKHA